jgi:hypothetical protein
LKRGKLKNSGRMKRIPDQESARLIEPNDTERNVSKGKINKTVTESGILFNRAVCYSN